MTKTIQSPGIELREIDKSEYGKEDYSLVGTTVLACGFATKGTNSVIQWINTIQNFIDTFGAPETDYEKYFYNAAVEVINRGGVFLGARLPYNNKARDHYASTEYQININLDETLNNLKYGDSTVYSALKEIDSTIKTYGLITTADSKPTYIEADKLEKYRERTELPNTDTIKIIDVSHSEYKSAQIQRQQIDSLGKTFSVVEEKECLGIVPVIVAPLNALFYQGILSSQTNYYDWKENGSDEFVGPSAYCSSNGKTRSAEYAGKEVTEELEDMSILTKLRLMQDLCNNVDTTEVNFDSSSYSCPISAASLYENSVSKSAAEYFPKLTYLNSNYLDRTYLKQLGVVVFEMFADSSNANTINFRPVESFVGSLDKNAKDPITKRSIFLDDVINSQSKYINFFSNFVRPERLNLIDVFYVKNQAATSLGIYTKTTQTIESDSDLKNSASMSEKIIDYNESIQKPLTIILETAKDKNMYQLDLVIDAGISTIAQQTKSNADKWTISGEQDLRFWKIILQKFNNFVQFQRKDCMFLADGPKAFGLINNSKIVRRSLPKNTVEKNILPKLPYMIGLNSSYSAGYCDWFLVEDAYSGDQLWLPPSIKAAGVYIFTDVYYNPWDAPAGINRGTLNVLDCAFSPSQADSDRIYTQCWNYAVSYPLDGVVLEGQKTFQIKKTAFDRVNVRRLFLNLEKRIGRIGKYFMYEGNTEFMRQRFVDAIRPILDEAVQRNGILEYIIKCDDTNNPPEVIDRNELHCTIAIKPVKTIEFIILNFVCTNQSANVIEVAETAV